MSCKEENVFVYTLKDKKTAPLTNSLALEENHDHNTCNHVVSVLFRCWASLREVGVNVRWWIGMTRMRNYIQLWSIIVIDRQNKILLISPFFNSLIELFMQNFTLTFKKDCATINIVVIVLMHRLLRLSTLIGF